MALLVVHACDAMSVAAMVHGGLPVLSGAEHFAGRGAFPYPSIGIASVARHERCPSAVLTNFRSPEIRACSGRRH